MKEVYILLFIILTIIIYFCYIQNNIENYTDIRQTGWTKLSDTNKKLYNTLVKDLCEGVILPDGWGCYKKKMDFTNNNWINDNSKNEFYIYNPRKNKVIYFNSRPYLNHILTNLESDNPIVKNRLNMPNIKWPKELIDPDTMGKIVIYNENQYNDFLTKQKNSKTKYFIALP